MRARPVSWRRLFLTVLAFGLSNAALAADIGAGDMAASTPPNVIVGTSAADSYTAGAGYFKATAVSAPTNGTLTTCTGTLTTGTYYYRVSATNAVGETLGSTETSKAITGPLGVNVVWAGVTGATGYKVYGRSTGAELLIATISTATTLNYCDSGSVTPSGALPTANTTGASSLQGPLTVTSTENNTDSPALVVVPSGATHASNGYFLRLNIPGTDHGPFGMAAFDGCIHNSPSGTWDACLSTMAYNALGDSHHLAGEPTFAETLETDWETSPGVHWMEWYLNYVDPDGVTGAQPIKLTIDRSNHNVGTMHLAADQLDILAGDVSTSFAQFKSNGFHLYTGLSMEANQGIASVAGIGFFRMGLSSGVFETPTGAATFNGSSNAFTHTVTLNGGLEVGNSLHVASNGSAVVTGTNTTTYAGSGSGDILLDNGTSSTPATRWLTGTNTNGCIRVVGGNITFGRNCGESTVASLGTWGLATANLTINGTFQAGTVNADTVEPTAANSILVIGAPADGASAVGIKFGAYSTLSNAGAKIASFTNNQGTTEKSAVYADGAYQQSVSPTLPTCGASYEGREERHSGGTTGARTTKCMCTSDGGGTPAYAWMDEITGTVGTTTTCAP